MIHDDNNILGILHQNNVESLHIQKLLQLTKERSWLGSDTFGIFFKFRQWLTSYGIAVGADN